MKIEIVTEEDRTHTVKAGMDTRFMARLDVRGLTAEQAVELKKALEHAYAVGKFEAANDLTNLTAKYRDQAQG
jgi:hypothetical protein